MIFLTFAKYMEVKTKAIVLRTVKYGDSRMIVDMLTAHSGRVSFACTLSKTNHGKIKKQLFQPLTILEIDYDERTTTELQRLRDVRMAHPYASLPFDPYKLSIGMFLTEFLLYATRGEHDSEHLEDFTEKSLLWLDNASEGFANFHLVFTLHVSLFIGFYPNLDEYSDGAWFDLRDGSFTKACPLHPDYLCPEDARKIRLLMRMNFDNMRLFKMNREERNQCLDVIVNYYRLHVPGFPELKSLAVLKTLF